LTAGALIGFLGTILIAGLLGAAAMELTMWLISRAGWAKGNMIIALGSLFTHARQSGFRVGAIIHAFSAIVFATLYALAMLQFGFTAMPGAFILGLSVGFVHGMLVSLMLVWVVAEQHPLEEFKGADLAIGLCHLAGHVAFGGMVGLVIGLAPV
jgi:hypothetical protein